MWWMDDEKPYPGPVVDSEEWLDRVIERHLGPALDNPRILHDGDELIIKPDAFVFTVT